MAKTITTLYFLTYEKELRYILKLYVIVLYNRVVFTTVIVVCGGIVDANIHDRIEFPAGNLTAFLCQWNFPNTNGTLVIDANFKVYESKMSCSTDDLLTATDGKYFNLLLYI